MPQLPPASSFDEILAIFQHLPAPNQEAVEACRQRESQLTKPAGALGRLEHISEWFFAYGQGVPIRHPRAAVFAGNHGVVKHGVSAFPPEVTAQMVTNFAQGGACINQLCALHGMDLRVYEMNLEQPTKDFTVEPAMSEEEVCIAIAYGMTAVEENVDFLCLGEMGIGNTTSAAALCYGLFGGSAADWTGPGTGMHAQKLHHKAAIVEKAVQKHKPKLEPHYGSAFSTLRYFGGFELCAMIGAIIAARMGRVPVLLDGYVCTSAAMVLHCLSTEVGIDLLAHCLLGHTSAEPAYKRLCKILDKRPLLDLDMRLGEASGAVLAFGIVKAALACHANMATFAEASVRGATDGA